MRITHKVANLKNMCDQLLIFFQIVYLSRTFGGENSGDQKIIILVSLFSSKIIQIFSVLCGSSSFAVNVEKKNFFAVS